MNTRSKKIIVTSCCLLFAVGFVASIGTEVFAQVNDLGLDIVDGSATKAGFDPDTDDTTFARTIGQFIRAILSLTGVIFTVLAVYAGILWMTARGDEGQVERSQKILQNALIGLVIAVSAYAITGFVMQVIVTSRQSQGITTGESDSERSSFEDTGGCCIMCLGEGSGTFSVCNANKADAAYSIPSNGRCSDLEDDSCPSGDCKIKRSNDVETCNLLGVS